MTDDELKAIKDRCEKATPGPWYPVATDDECSMNARYVGTNSRGWPRHDQQVGMNGERAEETIAITLLQYPRVADVADERWDENADFIAHAREDIPKLIAEVERLKQAEDDAYWRGKQSVLYAMGEV